MSPELISHSPDLQRLVDEGYEIRIRSSHLVLRQVPYVTEHRTIMFGDLVTPLTVAGSRTAPPNDHTIYFSGEYPCDDTGTPLEGIRNASHRQEVATGLWINHMFSARPDTGAYRDFHHKMTTYAQILGQYARRIDPGANPRPGHLAKTTTDSGPFRYLETASSRSGITALTEKLSDEKIGIIGLGGTGSYILDYVSKTPVAEIHLFDGDNFQQHNAFRAPGATSISDLESKSTKVALLAARYSVMRSGIVAHPEHVSPSTVPALSALHFVFVSIDDNETKRWLLPALQEHAVPFIDVGIGVERADDKLLGVVRTSMSTADAKCYEPQMRRILETNGNPDAREYQRNVQIVELNALNAALAVIRWKKYRGFYVDLEGELQSNYTLDGNHLLNCGQERHGGSA